MVFLFPQALFANIEEGNWLDQYSVLENLCNTISVHITSECMLMLLFSLLEQAWSLSR